MIHSITHYYIPYRLLHTSIAFWKRHPMYGKLFLCMGLMLMTFCTTLSAKTMAEIWKSMPDSIAPYLESQQRQEMPEFASMHLDGSVDNLLNGKSRMDTLTNDYIHVLFNQARSLELRRLPLDGQDSIICFVETWTISSSDKNIVPNGESCVRFFTQDWKELSTTRFLGVSSINDFANDLTAKPDTMSEEAFKALRAKIDPLMVLADLKAEDGTLSLKLSLPLLSLSDCRELRQILVTRQLTWKNGSYHTDSRQ